MTRILSIAALALSLTAGVAMAQTAGTGNGAGAGGGSGSAVSGQTSGNADKTMDTRSNKAPLTKADRMGFFMDDSMSKMRTDAEMSKYYASLSAKDKEDIALNCKLNMEGGQNDSANFRPICEKLAAMK